MRSGWEYGGVRFLDFDEWLQERRGWGQRVGGHFGPDGHGGAKVGAGRGISGRGILEGKNQQIFFRHRHVAI